MTGILMALATVTIHSSQFPENVRRDLLQSLRTRMVNHKFHYESHKQAQKWLALHEAFSPARTDPDCIEIYDRSFRSAAAEIAAAEVQVIGLGCGGGQKDVRLLCLLADRGKMVSYRPCDVSLPLVLTAREAARQAVDDMVCEPLLFDLTQVSEPNELFGDTSKARAARLFTFFGMIPNFEPEAVMPVLSNLARARDRLLFSANLAPGADYAGGMQRILPGYDNTLTRDWLTTFLFDLGFEAEDGRVRFSVEDSIGGHKRVVAYFGLTKERAISVYGESFVFHPGERIRLFFSYRYTPERIRDLLKQYHLKVCGEWVAPSEQEGVFLCQKEYP